MNPVSLLFGATAFVSAWLLFQVQPIVGRLILPWFGSTAGVWATCLLFFQALLLLGYSYAHFVVNRWSARQQAMVHGGILALTILALPITPDAAWKPEDANIPIIRILAVLSVSVGLPYLVLSTTGPLLQAWFARLSTASPYRLYALSNAGSLLGLLTYPALVEPSFALSGQALLWSLGFVLFALLCGACALLLARLPLLDPALVGEATTLSPPGVRDRLLWVILATCGSALLVSTTNQLTLDVAPIPLLWIVPLSLYLLSFVLCFDHDRWYVRPLFFLLFTVGVMNAVRLIAGGIDLGIRDQVFGYALALFAGCMCCHGEMARRRPAPRHLTIFFLMLAIGGVIGGLLVAVVAPLALSGSYEYSVVLVLTWTLVALGALADSFARPLSAAAVWRRRMSIAAWVGALLAVQAGAVLTLAPGEWISESVSDVTRDLFSLWLPGVRIAMGAMIAGTLGLALFIVRRWPETVPLSRRGRLVGWLIAAATITGGAVALAGALFWLPQPELQLHVTRGRNFYGALAIKNYDYGRYPRLGLKHGRIRHGIQLRDHPDWPTYYYGPNSGVGTALLLHPARRGGGQGLRVGVVGLGAGTLAAYANAGFDAQTRGGGYSWVEERHPPDTMVFYELNPMVIEWAEERFTFLPDARRRGASVETIEGDARIVMERQLQQGRPQRFDVLVLDAFSGDAIPMHLLTRESFEVYRSHMAENGILAVHVPNRYLDVKPVVHRLATELGVELLYVRSWRLPALAVDEAEWMLLTTNQEFLADARVRRFERPAPGVGPLWTDDYSSVFPLIRFTD